MGTHPLRPILFALLFGASAATLTAQLTTDAQGDIGVGTIHPHPSALLELSSNTKGFLPPRLTTAERNAIVAPAEGLMIFNTTLGVYQFWKGASSGWETFGASDTGAGIVIEGNNWLVDGNAELTAWDGTTGNFVGHSDSTDLILKTEDAEIAFWTGNQVRTIIDRDGNVRPAVGDAYTLGSDVERWSSFYVSGAGLHLGSSGGESDGAELRIGYDTGVAVMNVDGGTKEIVVRPLSTEVANDLIVNGAATIDGTLIARGSHLRSTQEVGPMSAASGPHVGAVVLDDATDVAGYLSISTSAAPLPGAQVAVTFNSSYDHPPIITLTPADSISPGVGAYVVTRAESGFVVGFMGMPAPSTSYAFFYQVIETE